MSAGTGKTGLLQGKPVSAGTGKTGLLQGKPVSAGTGKTGLLQDKPVSAGTGKTGLAEGALTPAIKQVLEEEEEGRPVKTAIICSSELADAYRKDGRLEACGVDIISLGAEGNDDEIAANLFAVLRKCDDDGIERIFSESFENGRIGGAIMNRLIKAAGHDMITVP
ncbi:MAG: Sua5 family C-terminal domain-containing protein [Lachnospiraceae bacterium]|nr:Sua5 family C-terminal domain-containing protein [Lachnospiraceae bacterium]